MGYWLLHHLTTGANTQAVWAENERGCTHERRVGPRGYGAQADREELGGRVFPPEAYRGPEGGRGAGAGDAASRRGAGGDLGGDPRYHLPGASRHADGRRRGRRTFGSTARVGGRRYH